jgi:hypothetical protein
MIRSAFNVASSLSLVLGCVIAAAWVWGRSTPRAFEFGYKGQLWQVVTDGGRLRIDNEPQRRLDIRPDDWLTMRQAALEKRFDKASASMPADLETIRLTQAQTRRLEELDGQWSGTVNMKQKFRSTLSRVPARQQSIAFAPLHAIAALLPFLRLSAWGFFLARRWSRRRAGLCGWCGYDLRGSSSGRCSECGHEHGPVSRNAGAG